jgi:hypothetical protein
METIDLFPVLPEHFSKINLKGRVVMAGDETKVTIVAWPQEAAVLEHHFSAEEPCPVSISFTDTPARVVVATAPQQPLAVDMAMRVTAREPIPLCLKVCEPICVRSDYKIGINIFDNPVASIFVRGMTKIQSCNEVPVQERHCVGFDTVKVATVFAAPFTHEGLTYSPLGGSELRAATFGEPAGRTKLVFMNAGLRVEFPQPVEDVLLTINNYAHPELTISAYAGTDLLTQFGVSIANTVKEVTLSQTGITALTITGGDNEAGLVEICYRPMQSPTVLTHVG